MPPQWRRARLRHRLAGEASIGCTARSGVRVMLARALPSRRRVRPRRSRRGRRTSSPPGGRRRRAPRRPRRWRSETPSDAPWRSSPPRTLTRNSCSIASPGRRRAPAARRAAAEPLPAVTANTSIARSTSPTVSVGTALACGHHATSPSRHRCGPGGRCPVRSPTTTSSRRWRRTASTAARRADLLARFDVAATCSDTRHRPRRTTW